MRLLRRLRPCSLTEPLGKLAACVWKWSKPTTWCTYWALLQSRLPLLSKSACSCKLSKCKHHTPQPEFHQIRMPLSSLNMLSYCYRWQRIKAAKLSMKCQPCQACQAVSCELALSLASMPDILAAFAAAVGGWSRSLLPQHAKNEPAHTWSGASLLILSDEPCFECKHASAGSQ